LNARLSLCLAALLTAQAAFADRVVHEKVVVARRHLTEHFDKIEAPHGVIRHVEGETLTRTFAKAYFFQVRYAAGSAKRLPGGLDEVNLIVVDADNKVHVLNTPKDLATYFRGHFVAVKTKRAAAEAGQALAALAIVRYPAFGFAPATVKTTVTSEGLEVKVRAEVREGGTGHVECEMLFANDGRLTSLRVWSSLKAVRREVRVETVVKRARKAATVELERLKINDGKLQVLSEKEVEAAFTGHVFFSFVGEQEKSNRWAGTVRQLIVVEPEGRVVVLKRPRDVADYVQAVYAPITTDKQARAAMHLFLILMQARFPEIAFDLTDKCVHVEKSSDTGRTVVGQIKARNGRGHVSATWRFGKYGRLTERSFEAGR
jgi:hypothetical protein